MQGINIFKGEVLLKDKGTQAEVDGKWVAARPIGYQSLRHRIKCAWLVFKQKADIVVWHNQ